MQLDDSLATGAANAAVSGNLQDFGSELSYLVHKAEIDVATAGGSPDVHVELEHLVSFYNALSGLHDQLVAQLEMVQSTASALHSIEAGGVVGGAKNAWSAMGYSAGLGMGSASSLTANLRAIDGMVLQHMGALHHNAQKYADNEGLAIRALGKASGSNAVASSPGQTPRPEASSHVSNTSGIGGK